MMPNMLLSRYVCPLLFVEVQVLIRVRYHILIGRREATIIDIMVIDRFDLEYKGLACWIFHMRLEFDNEQGRAPRTKYTG